LPEESLESARVGAETNDLRPQTRETIQEEVFGSCALGQEKRKIPGEKEEIRRVCFRQVLTLRNPDETYENSREGTEWEKKNSKVDDISEALT